MRKIELTKEKVALVSDEDYDWVSQWKWSAMESGDNWYAVRTVKYYLNGKRKSKAILMHREIAKRAKIDVSNFVDHKDRNSLNNQRNNLRAATPKQNQENRSLSKNNTSGYSGVGWHKKAKKWRAEIKHHGKNIYLGLFDDKKEAIKARKDAEKKYWTKI